MGFVDRLGNSVLSSLRRARVMLRSESTKSQRRSKSRPKDRSSILRSTFLALAIPFLLLTGCSKGSHRFIDLWLTPDQQGQRAFDQGDYREAAQRFEDPLRRGISLYLSQDFTSALAEFAKVETAEGWFNRGNCLAHLERYEEAVDAYTQALVLRPDFSKAAANIEYLQPFLPLEFEGGEMGTVGRDAAADEVVFDADKDRLDEEGIDTVVEGEQQVVSDEQLAEIWLRQVDTSPTSFLRYKFAYQAVASDALGDGQ